MGLRKIFNNENFPTPFNAQQTNKQTNKQTDKAGVNTHSAADLYHG